MLILATKATGYDFQNPLLSFFGIMIQIQSSWFPLADRNPQKFVNIYEARESDFQKATIQIYHSKKYPGKIILPVLTQ